jgi:phage-related holin
VSLERAIAALYLAIACQELDLLFGCQFIFCLAVILFYVVQ